MERLIAIAIVSAALASSAVADCGGETPCTLSAGSYHIVRPDTDHGPIPAVMFLHGHGGSAAGVLNMREMVESFTKRGYAVIAPNGARRPNGPRSWSFLPEFGGRDDFSFLPEVLNDAAARFDVDPERTVLAGFSSGAFMVNYLACKEPEAFAAYLPVSGGFWRPLPETCSGPVSLYQSHGWSDEVVPLEGRILGGGRFTQGDIWAGLELWRDTLGCDTHAPDQIWQDDTRHLRRWNCGEGHTLTFELFPGGHRMPSGWADRAITWIEAQIPATPDTE